MCAISHVDEYVANSRVCTAGLDNDKTIQDELLSVSMIEE